MIILLSLWASTSALTQETNNNIPDDLVLPMPEILRQPDTTLLTFTPEGYGIILKMYTAYQLYVDLKIDYYEIQYQSGLELDECSRQIKLGDKALEVVTEDREFAYKMADDLIQKSERQTRINKIKVLLLTSGGVLAGIGTGLLIGLAAF